jgi:PST family polysaccharide transporter
MILLGKTFLSNFSWLFIDKVSRLFLVLVAEILLARHLGPGQFGILSYALAIYSLLLVISSFGIDNLLIKELVGLSSNQNELLTSAIVIKSLGGFFAFSFTLIWVNWFANDIWLPVLLIGVGHLFHWLKVFELFFQSQNKFKNVAIATSGVSLLFFLLKIAFIYQKYSLIVFTCVYLAELICTGIVIFVLFIKNNNLQIKLNSETLRQQAKMGLPFVLSGAAVSIYMKIDQIMLQEMVNNEAVGIYAAATKLSEGWYFIGGILTAVMAPTVYRCRLENESKYFDILKKIVAYLLLIGVVILAFTVLFSEYMVNIVYGEQYLGAAEILQIHVWAIFFIYLGCVQGIYWVAEGLPKVFLFQTLLSAILNIVLNLYLIPIYSGLGAAWATLISYGFPIVLMPYFFKGARPLHEIHVGAFAKIALILRFKNKSND